MENDMAPPKNDNPRKMIEEASWRSDADKNDNLTITTN